MEEEEIKSEEGSSEDEEIADNEEIPDKELDEEETEKAEGAEKSGDETSTDEPQWESSLDEKLSEKELKKLEKKNFKEKIKEKQQELNKKTTEIIEGQFLKVFDKRVRLYTIVFIVGAILTGIFTAIQFNEGIQGTSFLGKDGITNFNQFMIITISFTMIIGFSLILLLSRTKKLHDLIFAEEKEGIKALITGISLGIGFVVCLLWWGLVDQGVEDTVPFLQYQTLFGIILAIVFFGWNIIQIIYVKDTIEKTSIKSEARFQIKRELKSNESKNRTATILNIIYMIIPFVFQILFICLFLYFDTPKFFEALDPATTRTPRFIPDNFYWSDWLVANPIGLEESRFLVFFTGYFVDIWWGTRALQGILIWVIIVFGITIATTQNQVKLYRKSKSNQTINVYSGVFYIIFWFLLWIKLFLIINTYITIATTTGGDEASVAWYYQIFDWITSILLMVITILNLVRTFGLKIKSVESTKITKFNLVIILFIFVSSYWGGQWSLIASGTSQNILNLGTGVIVSFVYLGFYFWYSKWIMERRGFIRKSSFTTPETKAMLIEVSQRYKERLLQTIENEEIITTTLNDYMLEKKIVIVGGEEEDAVVETLEEAEKDKSAKEKFENAKRNLKEVGMEKARYEEAVENLKNSKKEIEELIKTEKTAQKEVDNLDSTIEENFKSFDDKKKNLENQISEEEAKLEGLEREFSKLEKPIKLEDEYNEDGSLDEESMKEKKEDYKISLKEYNDLNSQIKNGNTKIATYKFTIGNLLPEWNEAKSKFEDAKSKQERLSEIQQNAKDIERKIEALESDVVSLKESSEAAQPLLDSAEILFKTAEIENLSYLDLEKARQEETEAEEKLSRAQIVYENASKEVQTAADFLATLKTVDEIEKEIQLFEDQVKAAQETVANSEKSLAEKVQILEEKEAVLKAAKKETDDAKIVLNQVEKELVKVQKEYKKIKSSHEKANNRQQDIDNAKVSLEEAKMIQSEVISISKGESKLKEAESLLKEKKSELKVLKKQDPVDQANVDIVLDAINTTEVKIKQYNAELKDAKSSQSKVNKAQKSLNQLVENQPDLPAIEKELDEIEQKMQNLTDSLVEPQNIYEEKRDNQTLAQEECDIADKDVKRGQKDVTDDKMDLRNSNDDKEGAEQSLVERQNAETTLEKEKKNLTEVINILNQAKDNYTEIREAREAQEDIYNSKEDDADLDRDIYLSYKALKKAHKTFKEAVRSAGKRKY
ncbi:MAG: hypothetical protein ACTSPA_05680 [Promethearchaeota archaeon]